MSSAYITPTEIAEILRVSKMTVYRLIHSGELDSIQIGRSYRVHRKALSEYLNKDRAAA